MIELKKIEGEDFHVINNAEFVNYRRLRQKHITKPRSVTKKKYTQALLDYLDWYLRYSDEKLKGKTYKDKDVVCHVFEAEFNSKQHFKEFLKKSVFVSKKYVEYLRTAINKNNISRYKHCMLSLDTDLEWLIVNYEIYYSKAPIKISLNSGRNPYLSPTDIFSAARELFFIEETEKIEELYLRDLKPNVIFQIRQLIEVFGRNLLGYDEITDSNNIPVKKFTQVAWKFIQTECRKANSRISFPFDVNLIFPINTWANGFVHNTYIYNEYVQFYALNILRLLFKGGGSHITTFNGEKQQKFDIADIKIKEYKALKIEFENYLQTTNPNVIVHWLPEKQVGAYIISL